MAADPGRRRFRIHHSSHGRSRRKRASPPAVFPVCGNSYSGRAAGHLERIACAIMTRSRLMDLLRRAAALSGGQRLILAGSQALYASSPTVPELIERSEEADLLLVRAERALFLKLQQELGMESDYLR